MLVRRCANVGHVGRVTLKQRYANVHWPNVYRHISNQLGRKILLIRIKHENFVRIKYRNAYFQL